MDAAKAVRVMKAAVFAVSLTAAVLSVIALFRVDPKYVLGVVFWVFAAITALRI